MEGQLALVPRSKRGRPAGKLPVPLHLKNVKNQQRKIAAYRKSIGVSPVLRPNANDVLALASAVKENAQGHGDSAAKFGEKTEADTGFIEQSVKKWPSPKVLDKVGKWLEKKSILPASKAGKKRT